MVNVHPEQGKSLPVRPTNASLEAAHRAALTYGPAFSTDPILRWLCAPPSRPNLLTSPDFCYEIWHVNTRQATSSSGIITNIDGGWDSVAIHFVPGTANDSVFRSLASSMLPSILRVVWQFGLRLAWRGAVSYPDMLVDFKRRYFLPDRFRAHDYYLIAYLATLESRRGQGLGSRWVRWLQAKATKEHKPIFLETSTARAKAMYERCGFWTVDEELCGVGEVDEDGWSVAKGREGEGHAATGVRMWALVWWPDGMKEERRDCAKGA